MSLIRPSKSDEVRQLRVSVPEALAARLDEVQARARAVGQVFALSEAVGGALDKLIRQANKELDAMEGKKSAASKKV